MTSKDRFYRANCYNAQTLSALLKVRNNRVETQYSPQRKPGQTLPKFKKVYSESRVSKSNSIQQVKKSFQKQTKKVYSKLFNELKEIKETLKETLGNASTSKKKKPVKRKQKVITEISESDQMLKRSHAGNKNSRNYYDVLKHIEQIKNRNNITKTQNGPNQISSVEEQKTLFYGVDYIDNIQFKIKIKLSKTSYMLFAKNNHTKIMVEMSYPEYMKLNLSELKGNPCNILPLLKIENNKVKLSIKPSSEKKKFNSFKSFLSYY